MLLQNYQWVETSLFHKISSSENDSTYQKINDTKESGGIDIKTDNESLPEIFHKNGKRIVKNNIIVSMNNNESSSTNIHRK